MTPARFLVQTTSAFSRAARKLSRAHPDFARHYATAISVVQQDPYNNTRRHPIKKLEGVAPGDGQYRIRLARFRFRYDIRGDVVDLKACGLRREDTY